MASSKYVTYIGCCPHHDLRVSDASLSGLELSDSDTGASISFTPVFAKTTTSYAASVAYSVDQITVDAPPSDPTSTVEYLNASDTEIRDADPATESREVALSVGDNTIKVKVTAKDGTTTRTYTLKVARTAASAEASLTDLALSYRLAVDTAGTIDLTPAFASGTVEYSAEVGNRIHRVTVTPTRASDLATVAYLDTSNRPIPERPHHAGPPGGAGGGAEHLQRQGAGREPDHHQDLHHVAHLRC